MPASLYPDNFHTEIINDGFFVFGSNNEIIACSNMRRLSNKLLNNEKVDANERAMAGAIISHLIALQRGNNNKLGPMKEGDKVEFRDHSWPEKTGWNGRGTLASALTHDEHDKRGYYINAVGQPTQVFAYVGYVRRTK